MEALACGLPALVSDIPANKEWVRENVNGWLYPDGDVDALSLRIVAIAAMRNRLKRIGGAARATAERRADWRKNFATLLKTYVQVVKLGSAEA
jgi:glycosyltransferase involved in cell wall biosynthesis